MSTASGFDRSDFNESSEENEPVFIRILLVNEDNSKVLMTPEHGPWELPFFSFPNGEIESIEMKSCEQFQKFLKIEKKEKEEPCFVVVADLTGHLVSEKAPGYNSEFLNGFTRLFFVEFRSSIQFELPGNCEWKDVAFLTKLVSDVEYAVEHFMCISKCIDVLSTKKDTQCWIGEPRYQKNWFRKASKWFEYIVAMDGAEQIGITKQITCSHFSSLLSLDSSKGYYFLKASVSKSEEKYLSQEIWYLFPDKTVPIISVNEHLDCFIMKGLDTSMNRDIGDIKLLSLLADIQLSSLSYEHDLFSAGCEFVNLGMLKEALWKWSSSGIFQDIFMDEMTSYMQMIPKIGERLDDLMEYNIPNTLVHGDFHEDSIGMLSNYGDENRLVIFDWEFACLSHPFFDLHELSNNISDEALELYLEKWIEFEDLDNIREAYRVSKGLGWLIKMWKGMRFLHYNPHAKDIEEFVYQCFAKLKDEISKEK